MDDQEELFKKIDSVINNIKIFKKEPEFSNELKKREERTPGLLGDDNETLRHLARLIAYSQNADSGLVNGMLAANTFDQVFESFDVSKVAKMDKNIIVNKYWIKKNECSVNTKWNQLTVIRQQGKIDSVIRCAISLQSIRVKHGSFVNLLSNSGIPLKLFSKTDIEIFWGRVDNLKKELTELEMPFYKNTTSLLHLLLHIGYPCLKPDLVVMKEAKKFGAVDCDSDKTSRNLKKAITFFQYYSISRNINPTVLDFYLLVDGGQQWAKGYIDQNYHSLNPKSVCHN